MPETANMMTAEQAEQLATLVHSLRPTWHEAGIYKALEANATKASATTLALALLHAADDRTNRTPGILSHPGPHWDAARRIHDPNKAQTAPAPPRELWCPDHNAPETRCRPEHRADPRPANWNELVERATRNHDDAGTDE